MTGIEDMQLEIRRIGQGGAGRSRIGFVGSSSYGLLPTIIRAFRAAHPAVSLSLMPMNNADLHMALIRREVDVVFARPTLEDADFVTRKLIDEAPVVAMPESFEVKGDGPISLRDYAGENVILSPEFPRPSYADFVLNLIEKQGLEAKRRVFTMDLQTALRLVAIGEGMCIVPESVSTAPRSWRPFSPPRPRAWHDRAVDQPRRGRAGCACPQVHQDRAGGGAKGGLMAVPAIPDRNQWSFPSLS